MLLFHGTSQSCMLSIFKNDFYLDTSKLNDQNIVIHWKYVGNGIYFTDVATKSFNYTRANSTNSIDCLIIAEVVLGEVLNKNNPDSTLDKNKISRLNHQSILGIGKWGSISGFNHNNITIPNGRLDEINNNTYLRYNKYVVYDIDHNKKFWRLRRILNN